MICVRENNPIWDEVKNNTIGKEVKSYNGLPTQVGINLDNMWWKIKNDDEAIIGYFWIEEYEEGTEISIYLNETERGQHHAKKILKLIETEIISNNLNRRIIVTINSENDYAVNVANMLMQSGYSSMDIPKPTISIIEQMIDKNYDVSFEKEI